MNTREVLVAARELITPQANWTQGWYARNGKGAEVYPEEPSATCWCALGAVQRVTRTEQPVGEWEERRRLESIAWSLLQVVAKDAYGVEPAAVNDNHGHIATLSMFDEAIKRAERL